MLEKVSDAVFEQVLARIAVNLVMFLSIIGEAAGVFLIAFGLLSITFKSTKWLKIGIIVYIVAVALPILIS